MGLLIGFRGHEKVYFGAYDIRATFGWTIEALSDERYRIEF